MMNLSHSSTAAQPLQLILPAFEALMEDTPLIERLYHWLCQQADAFGGSFIGSNRTAAEDLHCSPSIICRLMRKLELQGRIEREPLTRGHIITVLVAAAQQAVRTVIDHTRMVIDHTGMAVIDPIYKERACAPAVDHVFHDQQQQQGAHVPTEMTPTPTPERPANVFAGAWQKIQNARPGYNTWFTDLAKLTTRRDLAPAARIPTLVKILCNPEDMAYSQAEIDARNAAQTPTPEEPDGTRITPDRAQRSSAAHQRRSAVAPSHLPTNWGMEWLDE